MTMKTRLQLKHRRERAGLTQRKVAKRLGVTRSHIANLENGHRVISAEMRREFVRALR